ncbi:CapA family protein [Novosphingobium aerophilum]|uniref:CapA family protein n=1 Tax=Novosphingobium aerophilum TaxID=2839843 RepID=A0A7X1FAT2_9SPHN|nr:CapA family protein [Novosphingobium aerophilum]MBC2653563.1 CapA family protein [Novosphingobium aerophilum]
MTYSLRLAALLLASSAALSPFAVSAQPARALPDPATFDYRDLQNELRNKMDGSYTVAVTGDLLFQEPAGKRIGAAIRSVLKGADTTIGNLEVYLVDRQSWAGSHGYRNNWAPKEVAADLADLGFDLVAPGEADGGPDEQIETMKYLDAVGIKRPGYGPNLSIARQPAFQELPQGRVAMVAAFPFGPVGTDPIARNKVGNDFGEEAGLNPLRLTQWLTVTQAQFDQLKAIRDSILARREEADVARPAPLPKDRPGRLNLFGKNYMVAEKPGEFRYEMDETDRQSQVLAVRNAKEYADFVVFTTHIHENRYAYQAYSQDHFPPDYVRTLARELIDNGADMFLGSGNHTMQGIEIYKGRPIFYNPGNFAVQRFGSDDSPPNPEGLTNIEANELREDWLQQYINLVAYVAQAKYDKGRLAEIRIYPVDLGVDHAKVPWSRSSIPQTPSPELANRILRELQTYSEPFGTKIEIAGGIGIIRIPPETHQPITPAVKRGR